MLYQMVDFILLYTQLLLLAVMSEHDRGPHFICFHHNLLILDLPVQYQYSEKVQVTLAIRLCACIRQVLGTKFCR
jgi:hypothetical protein